MLAWQVKAGCPGTSRFGADFFARCGEKPKARLGHGKIFQTKRGGKPAGRRALDGSAGTPCFGVEKSKL
jgi:hypothetical protein